MKQLEVVLKTVERCNINCSYCYMFNMGDKTYNSRPPYMSKDIAIKLAEFLKTGCKELGVGTLIIAFHGGEPLMQKKEDFKYFCELFYSVLGKCVDICLYVHTNAMLIDHEWINLFVKYNVGVGVSIDGLKNQHDIYRKDKRGKGTYDKVIQGIKILSENKRINEMGDYGLLCVINPDNDAKKIYRHFVDDLNARCIDFLLPHANYDLSPISSASAYGKYLLDIFDEWIKDDDPTIYVRVISSTLDVMLGENSHYMYGIGSAGQSVPIICINSDGSVSPTDEFRTMSSELVYTASYVDNISLKDYLELPLFRKFSFATSNLAKECNECKWMKICNGGSIVNRFSKENGFDNSSVYCAGLKIFYEGISSYLRKNMPPSQYQMVSKFGKTICVEKGT
jgi:uncharacterized protein